MADRDEENEDGARRSTTPNTKDAVKSLTTQIKDTALKFSGASKQSKPPSGSSSSNLRKEQRKYPDFNTASDSVPYPYIGGGSTSSTPAWDFPSSSHHQVERADSRFTSMHGDEGESVSAQSCDVVLEDDESKEWMAQVEPGVNVTFVSLPSGGNDLKRIRFSRDVFDKWQAQRWWGENYDRIVELYNVQRFNQQALQTAGRSEDQSQRESTYVRIESAGESRDWTPRNNYRHPGGSSTPHHFYGPSMDAARTTTSSRDEPTSVSNACEMQAEWVEEDEPGVNITIRQLPDGTRELRRVKFSRERFGEVHAKTWWEQNRDRIQTQYL
ncbi:Protein Brevis radix-like 1 [Hirschfeldia incana]|nr:Protein Brevis radix-like 1 [Hirschfeldia incana]